MCSRKSHIVNKTIFAIKLVIIKIQSNRISWHSNIKYCIRNGLDNQLPKELLNAIAKSNISRWKNESKDKYKGCEVARYIENEINLVKRIGENKNLKKANEVYFRFTNTFKEIESHVKGVKKAIGNNQELILETISKAKEVISVNKALSVFGISRATYQNYKNKAIASCSFSLFKSCVKKHPYQLLQSEIQIIKQYMKHEVYLCWSKSSIYYKALADNKIQFPLNTWYKYVNLLGFQNGKFSS